MKPRPFCWFSWALWVSAVIAAAHAVREGCPLAAALFGAVAGGALAGLIYSRVLDEALAILRRDS